MDQKILLAVDGSPASDRAIEFLEGYRGDLARTETVALNVQARPVALWPRAAVDPGAVESALLAAGREIAEAAAGRLSAAGLRCSAAVRLGFAADAILREAQAAAADLIVMGTRGRGALQGLLLGSVATRTAHGGAIPVCLVRPESALPQRLGRSLRVMLALDGSEHALRAGRWLAERREWLGELDVQIAYVQQPLSYLETVLPPHDDVIEQWGTRPGEDAARAARELFAKAGIRHHLRLSAGDPAQEMVHLASETKCELLVLGTRGLGAAHHALVGSVALKAAAHSAVPVVLVK
ncbi:MAG: universal stress protein [Burkholderiales bacterium]|nr:universal stress protein [Burkholderiales bacterium]